MLAVFETIAVVLWQVKGQSVLPAEFQLHWHCALPGDLSVPAEVPLRKAHGSAAGGALHAGVSWSHLQGEYADRGLLVLFIDRRF